MEAGNGAAGLENGGGECKVGPAAAVFSLSSRVLAL